MSFVFLQRGERWFKVINHLEGRGPCEKGNLPGDRRLEVEPYYLSIGAASHYHLITGLKWVNQHGNEQPF